MFLLKKLITYFVLLPPGNIATFLVLLSFYLFLKRLRKTALLTLLFGFAVYLLSIQPVASSLMKPLEHKYKVPPSAELNSCDALVVLGGGIKRGAPFLNLPDSPMEDAQIRLDAALKLFFEKPRPIIVSGYSKNERYSEAKVMAAYLRYMGVPKKFLIEENASADTLQNALFTAKVIKEKGFRKVCLITSAYHLPRAVMLFNRAGVKNLVPVPADFKGSSIISLTVYKFIPTPYWFRVSALALHEYFGLTFYLLRK
jgi:uncharacterized SAM-binding protein YcdF (DUF218 family)